VAKQFEAVFTSDWHLTGLNKHFSDGDERILAEAEKIFQYALNNGIKFVIIPGDISDNPNLPFDTYTALFNLFYKYDKLLTIIYVAGNHDFENIEKMSMNFMRRLSKTKAFKNLQIILKPERIEIEGVPVNLLPFPALKTLSKKTGALNVAHVEYTGAVGDNGRTLKTKQELQSHKNDFTISGHIHQYQYMQAKRAVYCGNPFQKNFGESLPKGFVHARVTLNGDRVDVEHKFVENKPSFTLQNIHIKDLNDFKRLKHDSNVRYKLHIDPDVPVPADIMLQYPNITGGIVYTGKGDKALDTEDTIKIERADIDPEFGLAEFLGAEGLDQKQIKLALKEVQKAKNALGF
jgi:DNA repair exonuclease SbcCD nuclease subunit